MKIIIRISLIVITLTCIHYYSKGQSTNQKTADELRKEIEAINSRTQQLYITENIDPLISLYADEFTFFPEYKPAIFEIRKLKSFFSDWFKEGNIKTYKKKIYTVELYSDHILEIGTFNLNYSSIHNSNGEYNGKYMILWKRNINGNLNILSETFGADKYIAPEVIPYADVQIEETNVVPKHNTISKHLLSEIEEFNAVVLKAVAEGDGNARANGFTNDAILMGNSDTIRIGMEAIRPKMLKTYTPETSYIVKHTYYRIYDLGNYVFVNGHYKGGWGDSLDGGRFEGNMSNLMKRSKNGKLLMHRQAGNRESLIIFKQ